MRLEGRTAKCGRSSGKQEQVRGVYHADVRVASRMYATLHLPARLEHATGTSPQPPSFGYRFGAAHRSVMRWLSR